MLNILEGIREECNDYMEKCNKKVLHHQKQSENAKHWENFLSFFGMFLSASTAFLMSILTVVEASNVVITIIGSTFAFFITINSKVKDEYRFLALYYQHIHALDEYSEIEVKFKELIKKLDEGFIVSSEDINLLVSKFENCKQKNHLQEIRDCRFFCCFK